MLKLLIVDDEALEREGLQMIIERSMPGAFEIYQADHSRGAIDLTDRLSIDILLMDIKMPGMSGLDAIRVIKKRHSEIKVVMITAYDYFEYAKEAISLGVKEYITKPAERNFIINLMQKLGKEIEEERRQREQQLRAMDQISIILPAAETELALMLISDHVPGFTIDPLFHLLAPTFYFGYAVTCIIPFGSIDQDAHERKVQQKKCVEKVSHLVKTFARTINGPLIGNQMTFFVLNDKSVSSAEYRKEATDMAQKLIGKVKQDCGVHAAIGIGPLKYELLQLRSSYSLSLLAAMGGGPGRFCFYDQLPESNEKSVDWLNKYRAVIQELESGNAEDIGKLLGFLQDVPAGNRKQSMLELSILIDWHFYETESQFMKFGIDLPEDELWNRLTEKIQTISRVLQVERMEKGRNQIDQIKIFLKENFMKELTLERTAREVGLSQYYFSRMFKQETGDAFIDYVTKIRIEKAKQLVRNPERSLKEICFEVGYHDPAYFSRVFKKIVGCTPSEYRSR